MRLFILAFLCGVVLLQAFPFLPDDKWIGTLIALTACIALLGYRYWRILRILIGFLLGFIWVIGFAHYEGRWTLPKELEGKTITVTGYIAAVPVVSPHYQSFLFSLKKIEYQNKEYPASGLIRLSSQDVSRFISAGDEWKWSVRLKQIHGTLNPGAYDYEAKAFQQGIRATGYVVKGAQNQWISRKMTRYPIHQLRQSLKEKIEKVLPPSNTSPWIVALILGERQNIPDKNWEILRKTGTNHLMAIAGLHIGFMSGFMYFLVNRIWRRVPFLMLRCPAQHAGAMASLLMAVFYSLLSGFLIPAERACLMMSVFIFILLMRRKIRAWQAWCLALGVVLLLNPLNVLTESFWLSFGAVAFIIYGVSGRLSPKGIWWKWGRIQWVIAVGLIPFSIWLFQECSIISFVANSVAIPWIGFLIVPLGLVGAGVLLFSETLGGWILIAADKLLSIMWAILTGFSELSWSAWHQMMPSWSILVFSCVGVVLLLLPIGFPGRYLGCIGLLPLILYKPTLPALGECWVTLLDVGQGLSTVVQTRTHFLVFDTGARLSSNFDMGASVVAPFLRNQGAKKIDMLVVSHGDNDHIGGSASVMQQFPVKTFRSSHLIKMPMASFCLRGEKWRWDNVDFEFLHPTVEHLDKGNDSSCVLRVSTGNASILFTGDIEKYAERVLVNDVGNQLKSDILIAPHHGSKTSSEKAFIEAVQPHYVLFPIGYRNRYHFPHPSVVSQYQQHGIKMLNSVESGAIQFKLTPHEIGVPLSYRETHRRYWNK